MAVRSVSILLTLFNLGLVFGAYTVPQCQEGRHVVVHLFEWKWKDIAKECEDYLGPKGFCAVQVSPPMEHIQGQQWWTRYQPVSYTLTSRSGNREEFQTMVARCRAAGVNIYVDAVINHMSGIDQAGSGTAGSSFDGEAQTYPGVPFSTNDFHQPFCYITNYGDPDEVRNCYLVGLNDLDGSSAYVQEKTAGYLNDLISLGVSGFRVDAAKHMWPVDIDALQNLLHDIEGGGRPYFYMEVIDQANEPITVDQYYAVGQTTEFRYCIKIAEGIKYNYGNLGAVYDQGWGMSDPEHAFVFVDNHDNQRGHGGGGSIVTFEDPINYRMAVAFMLAHDYGTKRVMSSYFFNGDTDKGPPESSPGCGQDWVCEHRWLSIGQMVEFTNAVYGEPIDNWMGETKTLAFSRGNKGFFAMGNLGREFTTGLPDGEYCDIISKCQQKIMISDGKGYFDQYYADEPVVAICVGCKGDGGTTSSTTTTTTTTTHSTTTTKTSTTTSSDQGCCDEVVLSSTGGISDHYSEALGIYKFESVDTNGRFVYQHKTHLVSVVLHHTTDAEHNWSGWQFTRDVTDVWGFLANESPENCPTQVNQNQWRYHLDGVWMDDETVTVTCSGDGPTSTTTSPGTTTATITSPGGFQRTIIFVEKETTPGQDVFIVGGIDGAPIDINMNMMPKQWESYNSWAVGDTMLDWDGSQTGQGTFNNYSAMGTPGAWTTDDETDDFYYELNDGYGPNFWIIDFDMDCSQTQDGWFEFNTIYSIGGESGEPDVNQDAECAGQVGGSKPIDSIYHMARCGYMNMFSYGKDLCQIENIPTV